MTLKRQIMMRAAERHEDEAPANPLRHLEPQGIAVKGLGAIQVRDLQVHVADRGHVPPTP